MAAFDDRQLVNEGGIAEQFIGQHLIDISAGLEKPLLHYWLREKKSANAEVDYVIAHGNRVLPVEVKAGTSGSLKSLHQFTFSKNTKLAIRFDLNPAVCSRWSILFELPRAISRLILLCCHCRCMVFRSWDGLWIIIYKFKEVTRFMFRVNRQCGRKLIIFIIILFAGAMLIILSIGVIPEPVIMQIFPG